MTRSAKNDRMFWLGVAVCTLYQSYRYPLQINTLGFSPNYSDTPFIWQAGKFFLTFPIMLWAGFRWIGSSARLIRWPMAVATAFLVAYCCFKMIGEPDPIYLDVAFWLLFSLVLVLATGRVGIEAIDKYLYLLLVYSLASDFFEVVLFLTMGRLPAMAPGGFYSARFGGFLDDPNGFAAILFLLMAWSLRRFAGRKRFVILGALTIALLLTQSWTALGFFLAVMVLYGVIIVCRRPAFAVLAACLVPFGIVAFVRWVQEQAAFGILVDAVTVKQDSLEGHRFPWEQWAPKWTSWSFFGESKYNPYESWWPAAMVNFGVVWFAVYLCLVVALLILLWKVYKRASPQWRPVYSGLALFGAYFAVGSFGLPFPIKFPINALFFLFFFLVAFGKIAEDEPSVASYSVQPVHPAAKATTK